MQKDINVGVDKPFGYIFLKNNILKNSNEESIEKVLDLYLKNHFDPSINNNELLILAIFKGKIKIIEKLLADERVDPTARQNLPLLLAIYKEDRVVTKALLRQNKVKQSVDFLFFLNWSLHCNSKKNTKNIFTKVKFEGVNLHNTLKKAIETENLEIFDRLLRNETIHTNKQDLVLTALKTKNIAIIQKTIHYEKELSPSYFLFFSAISLNDVNLLSRILNDKEINLSKVICEGWEKAQNKPEIRRVLKDWISKNIHLVDIKYVYYAYIYRLDSTGFLESPFFQDGLTIHQIRILLELTLQTNFSNVFLKLISLKNHQPNYLSYIWLSYLNLQEKADQMLTALGKRKDNLPFNHLWNDALKNGYYPIADYFVKTYGKAFGEEDILKALDTSPTYLFQLGYKQLKERNKIDGTFLEMALIKSLKVRHFGSFQTLLQNDKLPLFSIVDALNITHETNATIFTESILKSKKIHLGNLKQAIAYAKNKGFKHTASFLYNFAMQLINEPFIEFGNKIIELVEKRDVLAKQINTVKENVEKETKEAVAILSSFKESIEKFYFDKNLHFWQVEMIDLSKVIFATDAQKYLVSFIQEQKGEDIREEMIVTDSLHSVELFENLSQNDQRKYFRLAIELGNFAFVEFFLEQFALPDLIIKAGLRLAIERGQLSIVEYLLRKNRLTENEFDKMLSIAKQREFFDIIKLLMDAISTTYKKI